MIRSPSSPLAALAALLALSVAAAAQTPRPAEPASSPTQAQARVGVHMNKLADHYVEGPGYVTFFHEKTRGYGGTYGECEKNCLADARCKMIEFYKPLRKCHLYDHVKWSGKSRDADTALKVGQ